MKQISNCCKAEIRAIVLDENGNPKKYKCDKCSKYCDLYVENKIIEVLNKITSNTVKHLKEV